MFINRSKISTPNNRYCSIKMTKETRDRLYAHYIEIDYKEAAEDLLSKHPELAETDSKKTKKEK